MEAVVRVTRLWGIRCFDWPSMAIIWFKYIYTFGFFFLYGPHFFCLEEKTVNQNWAGKLCERRKMLIYILLADFMKCLALSLHWVHCFGFIYSDRVEHFLFWTERQKLSRIEELAYFLIFLFALFQFLSIPAPRGKKLERKTPFSVT